MPSTRWRSGTSSPRVPPLPHRLLPSSRGGGGWSEERPREWKDAHRRRWRPAAGLSSGETRRSIITSIRNRIIIGALFMLDWVATVRVLCEPSPPWPRQLASPQIVHYRPHRLGTCLPCAALSGPRDSHQRRRGGSPRCPAAGLPPSRPARAETTAISGHGRPDPCVPVQSGRRIAWALETSPHASSTPSTVPL